MTFEPASDARRFGRETLRSSDRALAHEPLWPLRPLVPPAGFSLFADRRRPLRARRPWRSRRTGESSSASKPGSCASSRTAPCSSTPFVTLTVDSAGERGLLGVAFDPAFGVNGFVYVYYTATTPATHNRLSRFTANGTTGDTAVPGSEVVLLDLDNLSSATNHNGGALHFGDGRKALRQRRRERQQRERADARAISSASCFA